jgi:hypothetical protein
VRLGSTNRQADRELVAELRRSVEGIAFDELPMPDLTVDDLDLAALENLFRDLHDLNEKELLTLRLVKNDQGRPVHRPEQSPHFRPHRPPRPSAPGGGQHSAVS